MKRKFTLTMFGIFSVLLPGVALAQEFGIPRFVLGDRGSDSESQIIIRVRNSSDHSNLCGSRFNLAQDGYEFPRPGSAQNGYISRSGRSTSYEFPRPSGSINYFQLPTGAKNPDLIGCVDTQRNIVFINILKPPVKAQPTPEPAYPSAPQTQVQPEPQPAMSPNWSPNQWQK